MLLLVRLLAAPQRSEHGYSGVSPMLLVMNISVRSGLD
jgi:hypothetical protein